MRLSLIEWASRREKNSGVNIYSENFATQWNPQHEPSAANNEKWKCLETIRQNAKDLHDTPAQIVTQNLQCVSAATQGVIPRIQTMKSTIRKIQAGTGNSYPMSHAREDINLTISFEQDAKGRDFLLYDLGASADRIMIFGTEINLLCGTFKVSPPLFDQAFVIHGFQSLPEGLHQYSNDPEFAFQILYLNALACIPPDDVQLAYDVLTDEPFFVVDGMQTLLAEFTTYFELT
ncbi:hypothetical protein ILUMI_12921 [Ignelater luminosus]|uniref:Uncharacterized protein n=1 Tax=Ignelater luminosus TaxID=2038154 RepID=A0A8K0CXN6_IGNLU|nr:hypothetical protein ILUMI_12921 [Ignelater luminosus]